jgi:hypothetical protein
MHTQAELGWAAGCVDSEGCIRIGLQKSHLTDLPQHGLYLAVSNTDPRMPRRFAEMFGGNVVNKTRQQKRRPVFEWRVFSTKAASVLQELRPYLYIKGEQADIAISFAATLGGHGRKVPAEVRAERDRMRAHIAVLKREEVS